ncbi:MAG: restriction endonuclease subunit S [Bacteroidales bacterium]
MKSNYKYLKFIQFQDLLLWDVKRQTENNVVFGVNVSKLGKYIVDQSSKYDISTKGVKYKILGVNNVEGIFDAYEEDGEKINQKYKKMESGWLAYNPYRINVGSIGIKRKEHKNEYISPAYVVFSCKEEINSEFVYLLFRTQKYNEIIRQNTTGSVRQNLTFSNLSNMPLPLFDDFIMQSKLVDSYNKLIKKSEECTQKAEELEKEIERYLLDELGIELNIETENNKRLSFFRFSDISDRWDLLSIQNTIFDILNKSKYKTVEISKAYDFISRKWDKNETSFKYIELGAIDPLLGVTETKEIETKKAPSRATQIVKTGDLIIGTTRPYLKKFAIVDEEYDGCTCSSGFQNIISKNNNLRFLYEYLKTKAGIEQMNYYMTGALYPAITSRDLKRILIPLPSIEKQNEIANHILLLKKEIINLREEVEKNKALAMTQFENEIFG